MEPFVEHMNTNYKQITFTFKQEPFNIFFCSRITKISIKIINEPVLCRDKNKELTICLYETPI